jgi:hypothetical protein
VEMDARGEEESAEERQGQEENSQSHPGPCYVERTPPGSRQVRLKADATGLKNKRASRDCDAPLLHWPGSPSIHGALP